MTIKLNNPFLDEMPATIGGRPNITGAGDNLLGRIANTFALARPEGQQAAAMAAQNAIKQQEFDIKNQGRAAAADALLKLGQAKTADEASLIIGEAVAAGADPSVFSEYTRATLDPVEMLGDNGVQFGNRFGVTRQGRTPAPKKPLVEINQGERENEFEKEFGKGQASRLNKIIEEVDTDVAEAERLETNLSQMEAALENAGTTGVADPLRIFAGSLAAQVGLVDEYDLSETASLETLKAAANDLIAKRAKQLGVNPTDKDAARVESIVAGIGKSNLANQALIDIGRQLNEKSFARAEIVQNALDEGAEKDIPKRLREFAKNNPLEIPDIPTPPPLTKDGKIDASKLQSGDKIVLGGQIYTFDGKQLILEE